MKRETKGRDTFTLCHKWNEATNPHIALSQHAHKRRRQLARAIDNRLPRYSYRELSNGSRVAVVLLDMKRPPVNHWALALTGGR